MIASAPLSPISPAPDRKGKSVGLSTMPPEAKGTILPEETILPPGARKDARRKAAEESFERLQRSGERLARQRQHERAQNIRQLAAVGGGGDECGAHGSAKSLAKRRQIFEPTAKLGNAIASLHRVHHIRSGKIRIRSFKSCRSIGGGSKAWKAVRAASNSFKVIRQKSRGGKPQISKAQLHRAPPGKSPIEAGGGGQFPLGGSFCEGTKVA